jgi:hypothetical protein
MTDTPSIPVEPLVHANTSRPMRKTRPLLMRWLTGKWLPLCCIEPTARWSGLCKPDGWGVYRLVALDSNGAPSQLARVSGIDPSGTLYIGAGRLRSRVGGLVRTHNPKPIRLPNPALLPIVNRTHSPLPRRLAKHFPPRRLAVTWHRTDSEMTTKFVEGKLLKAYEKVFGEYPPMNKR